MREIKFRAYDRIDKRIYYNVIPFGEFVILSYSQAGYEMLDIEIEDYDLIYSKDFSDYEIMQYTGLADKNGVEIYEGDVVNITQYFGGHPYGEMKHIIKRSKYNNNLVADSESGNWRMPEVSMSFRKSDDYEVIGSIYENPELLEGYKCH